jgi:hypothetical protein
VKRSVGFKPVFERWLGLSLAGLSAQKKILRSTRKLELDCVAPGLLPNGRPSQNGQTARRGSNLKGDLIGSL